MQLLPAKSDFKLSMALPRFLARRQKGFQRRHQRYSREILGNMEMDESGAKFDGMILEISAGGCSFRPASMYLLNRVGSHAMIETKLFRKPGIIRSTRPYSYGIEFFEPVSEEIMAQLLARHGGNAPVVEG